MKRAILCVLVAALIMAPASTVAQDIWTAKTDMPTARMFLSTSVVNGKIYAIGGSSIIEEGVATVERYDPETDTWTTRSPMPTRRWGLSTCVVDGKIYAIGGAQDWPIPGLRTVEEYDPVTDTWTPKSPMPSTRWSLCTSVVDGKIYAIGGEAPNGLQTMHEYDPAADTWTRKASMTIGRYAFGASAVNGKIYALGGVTSYPSSTAVVEEYDPASDTWTRKADMPEARTFYCTCAANGRIYVFGGAPHPDRDPVSIVYEYDPATDTWATKTEMLTARTGQSASEMNGKIYVIGGSKTGFTGGHIPVPTVEEHDPYPLIVDLNGDGTVDAADVCIMVDHWGEDYPLCDIGPTPWGDEVVDVEDLKILAEHLFEEVNDPTLVAHWPLDETEGMLVADSAGDHNGHALGDPIWHPDGGQMSGALELDGVDDFVSVAAPLNPADGPFSVLIWVKGGAPGQAIISESGGPGWLALDPVTGVLMTELTAAGRGASFLLSETAIDDGDWRRIGLVWDGALRTLYVDGIPVAEDMQDGLESTGSGFYIGAVDVMAPGTFFSGLIDDVRIYNRAVKP